jgi:hypothetical protein
MEKNGASTKKKMNSVLRLREKRASSNKMLDFSALGAL